MEALKSVYSDFRVDIERDATLKLLGVHAGSPRFNELAEIYDEVSGVALKCVKPGIAFCIRGGDIFGLEDELRDCSYAVVCFCTVGAEIGMKAAEQRAFGFASEADVWDAIGDLCLLRVKVAAFGHVTNAVSKQFLGMKKPLVPGVDVSAVFNSMVVMETEADKLFGAKVSIETDEVTPAKSSAFICGCDASLPLPFTAFTPPDCLSCLRRDCEYCEFANAPAY